MEDCAGHFPQPCLKRLPALLRNVEHPGQGSEEVLWKPGRAGWAGRIRL